MSLSRPFINRPVATSLAASGTDAVARMVVRTHRKLRFAGDSPLEEAVSSEPVSEAKFPASWENTGNFVRLGLRVRLLDRNQ